MQGEHHLHSPLAQLGHRLGHRRQRRMDVLGKDNVVKAHDSQISGQRQTHFVGRVDQTYGGHIIVAEHGGGWIRKRPVQEQSPFPAARPACSPHQQRRIRVDARPGQGLVVAGQALHVVATIVGRGHIGNAPVSLLQKVFRRKEASMAIENV
jgi:hypothetical protein